MTVSNDLESLIKQASAEVATYIRALQAENLRLLKRLAKVEAELTTASNTIEAIKRGEAPRLVSPLSDEELEEVIRSGDRP